MNRQQPPAPITLRPGGSLGTHRDPPPPTQAGISTRWQEVLTLSLKISQSTVFILQTSWDKNAEGGRQLAMQGADGTGPGHCGVCPRTMSDLLRHPVFDPVTKCL